MPLPSLPCGLMSTLSLSWSGYTLGSLAGDSARLCVALFQEHHQFLAVLDWALDLPGALAEMVNRAALTLKLLVSQPYGSLSQHPFGLPEHIGGERNWDYRYTWIRDASFTLYALIRLGYTDEAGAFMRWIEACSTLEPDGSLTGTLWHRRTPYPYRGDPPPSGGLPAVCARAHWQRCLQPAPARYLWRVNGCCLSL